MYNVYFHLNTFKVIVGILNFTFTLITRLHIINLTIIQCVKLSGSSDVVCLCCDVKCQTVNF